MSALSSLAARRARSSWGFTVVIALVAALAVLSAVTMLPAQPDAVVMKERAFEADSDESSGRVTLGGRSDDSVLLSKTSVLVELPDPATVAGVAADVILHNSFRDVRCRYGAVAECDDGLVPVVPRSAQSIRVVSNAGVPLPIRWRRPPAR